MSVHYFFVDFSNAGHYFYTGIECCDKIVAERFLQQYSKDVRYHRTSKEKNKKEKGKRKTPIGSIVCCKYSYDKINTFGNRKNKADVDSRHIPSIEEEDDGQTV